LSFLSFECLVGRQSFFRPADAETWSSFGSASGGVVSACARSLMLLAIESAWASRLDEVYSSIFPARIDRETVLLAALHALRDRYGC
jgi:hypothetical protein